jgi:hypothetical protein
MAAKGDAMKVTYWPMADWAGGWEFTEHESRESAEAELEGLKSAHLAGRLSEAGTLRLTELLAARERSRTALRAVMPGERQAEAARRLGAEIRKSMPKPSGPSIVERWTEKILADRATSERTRGILSGTVRPAASFEEWKLRFGRQAGGGA